MSIKLKIVNSENPLKVERQHILAKIITSKTKKEENILQEELKKINKKLYGK